MYCHISVCAFCDFLFYLLTFCLLLPVLLFSSSFYVISCHFFCVHLCLACSSPCVCVCVCVCSMMSLLVGLSCVIALSLPLIPCGMFFFFFCSWHLVPVCRCYYWFVLCSWLYLIEPFCVSTLYFGILHFLVCGLWVLDFAKNKSKNSFTIWNYRCNPDTM